MYLSFTRKLFCSRNKLACANVIGIIPYNSKINLASTIDKRDLKAKVNILIREFYFAETKNHFSEPLTLNGVITYAKNWTEITFKAKPNTKFKINFINKCHLRNDANCIDGRFYIVNPNNIFSIQTGMGRINMIPNNYLHSCTINDFGNIWSNCLISPYSNFSFDYTTDSNGLIKILFIECWYNPHYMIGTWSLTSYTTGNSVSTDFNTY